MSLAVANALWRLDAHIEKSKPAHHAKDQAHETRSDDNTSTILAVDKAKDADGPDRSPNLWESSLETSINGLTPTSPSSPLLRRQWLEQCVRSAHAIVLDTEKQQQQQQPALGTADSSSTANTYSHHPREWTLAARATLQTFGHVVTSLVEETISFDEDIAYWDGIVASKYYTVVYTINTAPLRLASWLMNVTRDVRRRIVAKDIEGIRSSILKPLLSLSFHNFYDGLLTTLRHPLFHTQLTLNYFLSPFASARVEARRRRHGLVGLRDSNAEAIGVLLKHGCRYDLENATEHHLKQTSVTSTGLMQTILRKDGVHVNEMTSAAANAEADVEESILSSAKGTYDMLTTACSRVLEGLQEILQTSIRQHHVSLSTQMSQNRFSRPSSLTRLWFPLTAFLLSSRVITTYITQHRVTLSIFIHDAADTVVAFGRNWVVAPCRKLLSIIRHTDAAGSDIALVSKASLQTDRDSLERMVLDFMSDIHDGDATDLDQLRTKVQEGDLTSVLKAYEKDLRRPFVGTFRGGLVRALLIQVQKTKVDIEVAMTGIDALLRSQELVFGFIGLTPGLLVSYAALRWLRESVGGRKGLRHGERRRKVMFVLRDVHRILNGFSTTDTNSQMLKGSGDNSLSSLKHGLLICAVERLVRRSEMAGFPSTVMHLFKEDVFDLLDTSGGVERQEKVLQRIQWTYAKYLS